MNEDVHRVTFSVTGHWRPRLRWTCSCGFRGGVDAVTLAIRAERMECPMKGGSYSIWGPRVLSVLARVRRRKP